MHSQWKWCLQANFMIFTPPSNSACWIRPSIQIEHTPNSSLTYQFIVVHYLMRQMLQLRRVSPIPPYSMANRLFWQRLRQYLQYSLLIRMQRMEMRKTAVEYSIHTIMESYTSKEHALTRSAKRQIGKRVNWHWLSFPWNELGAIPLRLLVNCMPSITNVEYSSTIMRAMLRLSHVSLPQNSTLSSSMRSLTYFFLI